MTTSASPTSVCRGTAHPAAAPSTVRPAIQIAVLKQLIGGRPASFAAAANQISPEQVDEIATAYGYPDTERMAKAIARLTAQLTRAINAAATDRRPTPSPPKRTSTRNHRSTPAKHQTHAGAPQSDDQRRYTTALTCDQLFIDRTYQRELEQPRVNAMAKAYDPALVGVLEVSARPDERYAVIDGQHRWAMLRAAHPARDHAPVVCQVHTGLDIAAEAELFHKIDRTRRRLTSHDRWKARRTAGDHAVLDIERIANKHGLRISAAGGDGNLRCTAACEKLVRLGSLTLLDAALSVVTAAYGTAEDGLVREIVLGTGLVLNSYSNDELHADRLVAALQTTTPRRLTSTAAALRDNQSGDKGQLVAAAMTGLYNRLPGPKVEPFIERRQRPHRRRPHGRRSDPSTETTSRP